MQTTRSPSGLTTWSSTVSPLTRAQLLHDRQRDAPQFEPHLRAPSELDAGEAEAEASRLEILREKTVLFEHPQDAVHGALGHVHFARDGGDAPFRLLGREEHQDANGLVEDLDLGLFRPTIAHPVHLNAS